MRLNDVNIGSKYRLNGRVYLRINDELLTCFIDRKLAETMVVSLDLEDYRVMCHNREYEVEVNLSNSDTYEGF